MAQSGNQKTPAGRRGSRPRKAINFPLNASTGYLIREVLRLELKLLRSRLAFYGVPTGYFLYLRALWEQEGITQRELGWKIGVNDASSRMALEGMEKQGLVRRRRSATDLRKIGVFLTAKAKAMKDDFVVIARDIDVTTLKGLSASEVKLFRSYLLQARKNLDRVVTGPAKTSQGEEDAA